MRGFDRYAALLRLAMSMDEARETLGFPAGYSPSPDEINKAYRRKAIENHPDRGGSHAKMVEVNIAKEILEGKRHDRFRPAPKPEKNPEEVLRQERVRKQNLALSVIDAAQKAVQREISVCLEYANLGRGKINIREFFIDDYAEAIDQMQDLLESHPSKDHPHVRKAEALFQSLSNKALRLGKKYLGFVKLQGEAVAASLGMGGTALNYDTLSNLFAEAQKFIMAFDAMYEESRKLVGIIRMSEHVPIEWDDMYYRSHSILEAFARSTTGGWANFNDSSLRAFKKVMEKSVEEIGKAVLAVSPEAWEQAPDPDVWRCPEDFQWARQAVSDVKTASRVVDRFRQER